MITFLTIWLLHSLALITPGVNVLLVSHLAASGRVTTAAFASIGIATGAAIWATAAVLGINTLFEALPRIRLVIQFIGVLYLLYIATLLWKAKAPLPSENIPAISIWRAFRRGLLVNLTNPKAALFYGGIFSATLPLNPSALFLVSAILLLVINCLCWHLLLSFVFSKNKIQVLYSKYAKSFNKVAGTIFGTLGVYLFIATIREARK